jgi:hypothetical protein
MLRTVSFDCNIVPKTEIAAKACDEFAAEFAQG